MNATGRKAHVYIRFLLLMLFCYAPLLCSAQIHEKVLICGVCRNVEKRLEKTKKIMESIGALFDDYKILVYENNSTDRTAQILKAWAHQNPRVWLKSETLALAELEKVIVNVYQDGRLYPPEQICRARNVVLDQALDPIYNDFPFIIWMDMDFVRFPDLEGFVDTFYSRQP